MWDKGRQKLNVWFVHYVLNNLNIEADSDSNRPDTLNVLGSYCVDFRIISI